MNTVTADPSTELRHAMADAGITTTAPLIADGMLHRVHVEGDARGSRNGWYVLYPDAVPAAAFGCWKRGVLAKWCARAEDSLSKGERTAFRRRMEEARDARQLEEQRRHQAAAAEAERLWASGSPADPSHPYLVRKGVEPYGIRQRGSELLIPMRGSDDSTRGLQRILWDGTKRYLPGTEKRGSFYMIGKPDEVVAIAEGYATAATVHQATGYAVAVAFDAGNLTPVAVALRERYPNAQLVIAADNDRSAERVGIRAAESAAVAAGAVVAIPEFGDLEEGSDWNDIAAIRGVEAVASGVAEALRPPPVEHCDPDPRVDDAGPSDRSHDALALELGELWDDARYVAPWGTWFFFDEHVWREDERLEHMTRARAFLRAKAADLVRWAEKKAASLDDEGDKSGGERIREQAANVAKSLRAAPTVAQVVGLARSNPAQAASVSQWDEDPLLLGTPAGTLDLRTGELRASRPTDYITKSVAVAPAPPGTMAPLWTAFLRRVTDGDPELIAYLQRFAGYSLTGSVEEHAFVFAHGQGGNGKGVLINTLHGIYGDYAAVVPTEMLMASQNDRHPTELARLRGVRLAIGSETEQGTRWAEAQIKRLTGGDPIPARKMRQDFFEFLPQFKLFVAGNHKPSLRGVDAAMRRRMHFVPFTVTIPEAERDTRLPEKLRAEWPAILRWAVDGAIAWQREGLKAPEAVRGATLDYLEAEDAVSLWLDECTSEDPAGWEAAGVLFASWKEWAERAGEYVGSQKRLTQVLQDHGLIPHRLAGVGTRGFRGRRVIARQAGERWAS